MIPVNVCGDPVAELHENVQDEGLTMPPYQPDNDFMSLTNVALRLRGDVMKTPGHKNLSVDRTAQERIMPESLLLFLNILVSGSEKFVTEDDEEDQISVPSDHSLNTGQDIMYRLSSGRKWTPKHVGLAGALHQSTRSKKLVNLFHKAGHCLSYQQLQKVDTGLAEYTCSGP